MTTLMDILRYSSGIYGEEAADLIEKQEQEIADHEKAYAILFAENAKLRAAVQANVPDVDALANFIREIDGAHRFGAGALAEKICEWLSSAPPVAQPAERNQCDGCRRGLPIKGGLHTGPGMWDKMVCQAHKYGIGD